MRLTRPRDTRLDMQTIPSWLFCWQWIAVVLKLGASAASAMPVIVALTLATGRRGQARLSAYGARRLALAAAALAILGPLLLAGDVLALLASLRGPVHMLEGVSLWMPAMLPYTTAAAAWVEPVLWHPEQQMSRLADSRIHLKLPFNDLRELTRDLLRFAAEMEVLSPPELRQAVISAMQAGLARHSQTPEPALR